MTEELERSTDARYLILMRHAKSDWGDESLSDHDRPLNRRGQRDNSRLATCTDGRQRLIDMQCTCDPVISRTPSLGSCNVCHGSALSQTVASLPAS